MKSPSGNVRSFVFNLLIHSLVVMLVLGGGIFLIREDVNWDAIWQGAGKSIPTEAPDESRRTSVGNCSLILPLHWESRLSDDTQLTAWPMSAIPRRYAGGMSLSIAAEAPPEIEAMSATTFLGYNAFESIALTPDRSLECPPYFCYKVAFSRDGQWYILTYWNFSGSVELPPMAQKYMETLTFH